MSAFYRNERQPSPVREIQTHKRAGLKPRSKKKVTVTYKPRRREQHHQRHPHQTQTLKVHAATCFRASPAARLPPISPSTRGRSCSLGNIPPRLAPHEAKTCVSDFLTVSDFLPIRRFAEAEAQNLCVCFSLSRRDEGGPKPRPGGPRLQSGAAGDSNSDQWVYNAHLIRFTNTSSHYEARPSYHHRHLMAIFLAASASALDQPPYRVKSAHRRLLIDDARGWQALPRPARRRLPRGEEARRCRRARRGIEFISNGWSIPEELTDSEWPTWSNGAGR